MCLEGFNLDRNMTYQPMTATAFPKKHCWMRWRLIIASISVLYRKCEKEKEDGEVEIR